MNIKSKNLDKILSKLQKSKINKRKRKGLRRKLNQVNN